MSLHAELANELFNSHHERSLPGWAAERKVVAEVSQSEKPAWRLVRRTQVSALPVAPALGRPVGCAV